MHIIKGSLEDTSVLRRVEQGFDWKGRGKGEDERKMGCQSGSESKREVKAVGAKTAQVWRERSDVNQEVKSKEQGSAV